MARPFTPALFDFLFDLDVHNERAWFDANRQRFEDEVREPVLQFVRDMRAPLARVSRHLVADDRKQGGSMFRIHRDTRFSADPRPYKTNVGVQFRHERARDVHAPGLYLHLEPGNCFAGAGMWRPDTATLGRLRDDIVDRPAVFRRMRTRLAGTGWEFGGDALKRAPRGHDADHELIEELRRTSWILTRPLDERTVTRSGFLDRFVGWALEARPLMSWQCRTLGLPW